MGGQRGFGTGIGRHRGPLKYRKPIGQLGSLEPGVHREPGLPTAVNWTEGEKNKKGKLRSCCLLRNLSLRKWLHGGGTVNAGNEKLLRTMTHRFN